MRASVIISAFNEGGLLTRTVESVLATLGGLDSEVLVVDDASTDGSVAEVRRLFPPARIVGQSARRGVSATKALGAESARGDVLVFLDAHTRPEADALETLVRGVEEADGGAILTPAIASLDVEAWRSDRASIGHGYTVDLRSLECSWLPLTDLTAVDSRGAGLYESPAFIGCAFAISRRLYQRLWGFDPHMRRWGVEDIDLGLKCWLLGFRILHDPSAVVGHRFRDDFTGDAVAAEDVLHNELRLARKALSPTVWEDWVSQRQLRTVFSVPGVPEGLWARAWNLFERGRDSVESERSYLHGQRTRDEFWYARRFGLSWPRWTPDGGAVAAAAAVHASGGPGGSPRPSGAPPTPTVEIQVNNTPATTDDLVQVIALHPAAQAVVNCRIRLSSTSTTAVTVVLTDPNHRLGFPNATDTSRTLVLPPGGGFVAFSISGQVASAAVGDAIVQARVGTATGAVCGTTPVTVVSFSPTSMTLTPGGNYGFVGNSYTSAAGPAVAFSSSATVHPAGVACSAPQLATTRIAIMQESSNFAIVNTWDTPTIAWLAATPSGTAITVPTVIRQTITYAPSVTQPVNDGVTGAGPLYERGAAAFTRPLGCPAGAVAVSSDTPSQTVAPTFAQPAVSGGVPVGTVTWTNRVNTVRREHFRTCCVSFDTATSHVVAQRQATWDLNADSAAANQHATVTADAAVTADPAVGVQANNAATSTAVGGVGAATTPFTKP